MSQISKCPNVTVVLTYWEASGEVSELSYKSLLYSISVGSYCIKLMYSAHAKLVSTDYRSLEDSTERVGIRSRLFGQIWSK